MPDDPLGRRRGDRGDRSGDGAPRHGLPASGGARLTKAATAALALFAALAPLLPGLARWAGSPAGSDLVLAAGIAASALFLLAARRDGVGRVIPEKAWRFALGFLAVSFASCLLSIARGETLYLLLRGRIDPLVVNSLGMTAADRTASALRVFLALSLLLLAVDAFSRLARSPAGRRTLLASGSAGAALAGLAALLPIAPMETGSAYWKLVGRTSGSFTDPNALGVGLALLVPISAAALLELRGAIRALPLAALLLAPFALERSGSRSALILLAVAAAGTAVGGLRSGGRTRRRVVAASASILALGGLLLFLAPRGGAAAAGGIVKRVGGALSARSVVELTSHRPLFWSAALDAVREEPLTGCGLGGFPFQFPAWYERTHGPALFTDNATNALLDVAAESGLPALLLALGAVVPLLALAARTLAARWPGAGWSAAAGSAALWGLAVASLAGSHVHFPEVAAGAALAAAFLPYPAWTGKPGAEGAPAPKRLFPVLVASGILASCLAAYPTAGPDAPFRAAGGGWIGVYPREGSPASRRQWTGRRIARALGEGERTVCLALENARPDGRPVLAELRVDDGPCGSAVLPPGEARFLSIEGLPAGGKVLSVAFSPVFVPARSSGSSDRRTLGVLLRSPGERPR